MLHPRVLALLIPAAALFAQNRTLEVRTPAGVLRGALSDDGKLRAFKGIPFAAPPVGPLRWQRPQPVTPWTGARDATAFGAHCVQARIFDDIVFRDSGASEDCLYLNVWTPAESASARLPVMVWIYGGGFAAGAASEARQDGANLAHHGVVVVSMNYRLGIFGFFSHAGLAGENHQHASGNYGLMDQAAAIRWVHDNIALFGGDPGNVTIFGESAGSFSVSALMASPLSKGLIHRAIGESGGYFGETLALHTLAETEKDDMEFARKSLGTDSLEALRAKSADEILKAVSQGPPVRFVPNIDGYVLPESVEAIFAAGQQAHVPLLAGWNADEQDYRGILGRDPLTPENFASHVRTLYGAHADEILKLYAGPDAVALRRAAGDLASDRFIAFGTWNWIENHLQTGRSPVYRYHFEQNLPLAANAPADAHPAAPHASEIEFVFQMLSARNLPWRPEDQKVSDMMAAYWSNFAKNSDPNGGGLTKWPAYPGNEYQVMHIAADPHAAPDAQRARYLALKGIRADTSPLMNADKRR